MTRGSSTKSYASLASIDREFMNFEEGKEPNEKIE